MMANQVAVRRTVSVIFAVAMLLTNILVLVPGLVKGRVPQDLFLVTVSFALQGCTCPEAMAKMHCVPAWR